MTFLISSAAVFGRLRSSLRSRVSRGDPKASPPPYYPITYRHRRGCSLEALQRAGRAVQYAPRAEKRPFLISSAAVFDQL